MEVPRDIGRRALDRLVGLARSARGYLAGIGTSGSLLAGAALMFIVASALVGFRGWPHVGAQPSPREVVVSPQPTAATGSAVARRLAVISGAPAGGTRARGLGVGGARPGGAPAAVPTGTRRSIGLPAPTTRPVTGSVSVPTASGSAPSLPSSPGASAPTPRPGPAPVRPPQPVQQVVKKTTGAVGGVVSSAGQQAGSVVRQTTGAVGAAVQPVSPPAAGAVTSAGSGAAQTVTGVTNTIAGTLSGVGGN